MPMRQDRAVDGFRLAYERSGPGAGAPAVLLLHGWPGDRTDYREVAPLVSAAADVVVPDLRGFGLSGTRWTLASNVPLSVSAIPCLGDPGANQ